MSPGLKQRSGRPTKLPPEFEGVDWGIIGQRLEARRRSIHRIAARAEYAIMAAFAAWLVIAAPAFFKSLFVGLALAATGALQ